MPLTFQANKAGESLMQISEVMSSDVRLVDPNTKLRDAAKMMSGGDFGVLPIGESDRLVGTATDRDITVRGVALGKDPNATAVREVMSEGVVYCFEDQAAEEAAQVMAQHQVRRLPVLNRDKRLVGIVALADLAVSGGGAEQAVTGVSR
jgi:CBS domain-containing protein